MTYAAMPDHVLAAEASLAEGRRKRADRDLTRAEAVCAEIAAERERRAAASSQRSTPYACPSGVGVYRTQEAHFWNCRVCIGAERGADVFGCIQGCIIDSPHPGEDCLTTRPRCRHCDGDLVGEGTSPVGWRHASGLYSCQQKVSYGHNAAHPDIPCAPVGPNPCRCTYAPDAP